MGGARILTASQPGMKKSRVESTGEPQLRDRDRCTKD
jgi:hypothetical protein